MVYNEKYNRWFSKDGLIYRLDKHSGKLVLCKQQLNYKGYLKFAINDGKCVKIYTSHRAIWETFNGEIPEDMQIDHINTVRDDNRLENLRCVTPSGNSNNEITLAKRRAHGHYGEFGKKYFEHFGMQYWEDKKKYGRERAYFQRHNVCSWEVENG